MGAWEELIAGQLFNSIVTPFTSIIGTQMFYLILWGSVLGILMIKTKSWELVAIAVMVTSFVFVPEIFSHAQGFIIFFVAGAIVYTMYNIFKSKR